MSYKLRFSETALNDIQRLYRFLADRDIDAAGAALDELEKAWAFLGGFPFSARKVDESNPFLRELVIPFGGAGYVALFEIDNNQTLTILAVRHQREDDFH